MQRLAGVERRGSNKQVILICCVQSLVDRKPRDVSSGICRALAARVRSRSTSRRSVVEGRKHALYTQVGQLKILLAVLTLTL